METYRQMKHRHETEVNALPIMFAFSNKQFEEGMREKLGLEPEETDKIYKLGSTGGFYKKTDSKLISETFYSHERELKEAMSNDDFVSEMFEYELGNHEWQFDQDDEPVLSSLGLSESELDERLALIWKKAKRKYFKWCLDNNCF